MTRIFLLFFLILVDQASKYLIRSSGGFYICNKGIVFGIPAPFGLSFLFLLILSILILRNWKFVISTLGVKNNPNYKLQITDYLLSFDSGIILIFSGGLSNLMDRLYFGCVIDFIDLTFWPIFNLADIFICAGAIILIISFNHKNKE